MRPKRRMKELSKRDWLFVTLAAFVWSGTLFVVVYCRVGWAGDVGILLRLVTEPDHKTRATPKLYVVAVNQAFCLSYGLLVVATNERLKSYEMSVGIDGVSPIFHHDRRLHSAAITSAAFQLPDWCVPRSTLPDPGAKPI
jgi:hypothetical protein